MCRATAGPLLAMMGVAGTMGGLALAIFRERIARRADSRAMKQAVEESANSSNDSDESEITITASMSVTGAPNLSMELESVDFGEVWVGTSSIIPVTITNSGTDILEITNIQVSGGEFSVNTSSFSLLQANRLTNRRDINYMEMRQKN